MRKSVLSSGKLCTARIAPLQPGDEGRWTQLSGFDIPAGRTQFLLVNSTFHYEIEFIAVLTNNFRIETNQGYSKE